MEICLSVCVVSRVAGSSVGQSALWSVSQHCPDDRDQPPAGTYTTCPLSGICATCVSPVQFIMTARVTMKTVGWYEITLYRDIFRDLCH